MIEKVTIQNTSFSQFNNKCLLVRNNATEPKKETYFFYLALFNCNNQGLDFDDQKLLSK